MEKQSKGEFCNEDSKVNPLSNYEDIDIEKIFKQKK